MSSIFTQIIEGTLPSYKIYEDEYVYAFLDIFPLTRGHTLVVPKVEIDQLFDLDKETYHHLLDGAYVVANLLKNALGAQRVCVIVEGYDVPHAHIKLIPTLTKEDLEVRHPKRASEDELKEVQRVVCG